MISSRLLAFPLLAALIFWGCNLSESGKPDTLTFRLHDSLKTASGKYDSVQLDLYTVSGTDTAFRRMLFRGPYVDSAQLENLSLGENLSGDFVIRVIGYRDNEKILEVGVPFTGGQASDSPIVYISPPLPPVKHAPAFVSGFESIAMQERETRRVTIKAKDADGDSIRFAIQNLDSLRALFMDGANAISVAMAGDSLVLTFSPGSAPGNYRFRIALIDSAAPPVVQTLVISVGKVNRPPTLAFVAPDPGPDFLVREGKMLSFKVAAADPDSGDAVVFLALEAPPWPDCGQGGYDTATGLFSFTPSFRCADTGIMALSELVFRAQDKGVPVESGSLRARISVQDSNSAPAWKQDSAQASGKEGREMSLDLSGLFLGDREQDSVAFTTACGQVLGAPLRWSFTPGFRDSGEKRCEITAVDSHKPPASARLILKLAIADSVRVVDVAILSPARGYVTRDSLVVVNWKVGDQTQASDTTEVLGKEGPNLIRRTFKDSLGNSGADTLTVFRDTDPPKKPTVSVAALTNNPKPKWSWKSGGGGNGQYRIRIDTALLSTGALEIKDTAYTPTQALSHGRHVLYAQERDAAGNWSPIDSGVVRVDLVAPVVKITAPLDGHVTNQGSVEIQWTVDGKAQTKVPTTLAENGNTLTRSVTDSAGNTGAMTITVTRKSNVIFVNGALTAEGDGNSWATAHKHLQAALARAGNGSELWVAGGTYAPDGGLAAGTDTSFVMKVGTALYGGFSGSENSRDLRDWVKNETILSGETGDPASMQDNFGPIVVAADNLKLDGFVVDKGYAGAIEVRAVSIDLSNCSIRDNLSEFEGEPAGIWAFQSTIGITNCEFARNKAMDGGAIVAYSTSLSINGSRFLENEAENGAAMGIDGSSISKFQNCLFQKNTGRGAPIWVRAESISDFKNCYFLDNASFSIGGAIYFQNKSNTLINCVFSGNSAKNGGAIGLYGTQVNATNCTFYKNRASDSGGAFYAQAFYEAYSPLKVRNSILWENAGPWGRQIALIADSNSNASLNLDFSIIPSGIEDIFSEGPNVRLIGTNILSTKPAFRNVGNLAGADGKLFTPDDGLSLNEGPGVDYGTDQDIYSTDITGAPRIKGSHVDLGAYER